MSQSHLSIYLNDHLGGSSAGLDIVSTLRSLGENWAEPLERQIGEEQHQLETLMQRLSISRSSTRQAVGRISGKLAELKVQIEDQAQGAFQKFELLEVLSLGIEAKRLLWVTLRELSSRDRMLQLIDYNMLIARAEDQRRIVEAQRLRYAMEAMTVGASSVHAASAAAP